MSIFPIIAIITLLIAITGLYVAAEFASISARRPRLAQMASDGNRLAQSMLEIVEDPVRLDAYIAACQLGITVAGLGLGFYGQSRLITLILPLFSGFGSFDETAALTVATILVLFVLTVLTVLLGELMPKNLGIQFPERVSILTAIPMRWSMILFKPLIWFFNGSGQIILNLMGANAVSEHVHVHSPDEIRMLVEESSAGGLLADEERRLLVNTLRLRDITVRRAMLPRNRMFIADVEQSHDELLNFLADSPYSRLPLYEGSVDKIVGVVHLKDLLYLRHTHGTEQMVDIRSVMRAVGYVPESLPLKDTLELMQRDHTHLVIVVDEFGGTAGMLTIEDVFEEIIGDFHDEFDADKPAVLLNSDNRVVIQGDVSVDELNEWLDLTLPTESADTIGGLVFSQLGKLPKRNDRVNVADLTIQVDKMEENRIAEVSFQATSQHIDRIQEIVQ